MTPDELPFVSQKLKLVCKACGQKPDSAFLHTRLGNLMRGCRRRSQASEWYEKALELDAGDIEARYHLWQFALDDADDPAAVEHGRSLVRYLLEGCKTNKEELTRGIAVSVVEILRQAPPEIRDELVRSSPSAAGSREARFIRALLATDGDEDVIVNDAADRLLRGESLPEPASTPLPVVVAELEDDDGASIDLVPSLRELVEQEQLDAWKLTLAAEADEPGRIRVEDRHTLLLSDGKNGAVWKAPPLRELFRGDKAPPANMERYPPEYNRCFFSIEKHVLTACEVEGDRTDQEMEAIYSALRRRPDGKNCLGPMLDFFWQAAALTLGMHRLSQAEFEAIVGQLERSVRKWALRPVSRNYVGYLHDNFG